MAAYGVKRILHFYLFFGLVFCFCLGFLVWGFGAGLGLCNPILKQVAEGNRKQEKNEKQKKAGSAEKMHAREAEYENYSKSRCKKSKTVQTHVVYTVTHTRTVGMPGGMSNLYAFSQCFGRSQNPSPHTALSGRFLNGLSK